jgi:hypothetical protein
MGDSTATRLDPAAAPNFSVFSFLRSLPFPDRGRVTRCIHDSPQEKGAQACGALHVEGFSGGLCNASRQYPLMTPPAENPGL